MAYRRCGARGAGGSAARRLDRLLQRRRQQRPLEDHRVVPRARHALGDPHLRAGRRDARCAAEGRADPGRRALQGGLRLLPRRAGRAAELGRSRHAAGAARTVADRRRLDRRPALPHRQARHPLHRHAGLAEPGARRRGLDDGRLPSRAAGARQRRLPRARRRRRRAAGTACPLRRLPWRRRSRRRRARADPGRAERDLPAREPARLCRGPSRQRHHADGGPRVEPRRAGGARPTLRRLAGRGAARATARDRPRGRARRAGAARPTAFPPASIAMPAAATRTSPPSPGSAPTTSPRSSSSSAPGSAAARPTPK